MIKKIIAKILRLCKRCYYLHNNTCINKYCEPITWEEACQEYDKIWTAGVEDDK